MEYGFLLLRPNWSPCNAESSSSKAPKAFYGVFYFFYFFGGVWGNRCYYLVEGLACIPGPLADPSSPCIVVCCRPPKWKHWQWWPCLLVESCTCSFFTILTLKNLMHVKVWKTLFAFLRKEWHVYMKIYWGSMMTITVNLIVNVANSKYVIEYTSDYLMCYLIHVALWQIYTFM